ncbi:helix-turn-helix domain-containing protein [Galbibacter pacificus]|uniref:Helix-turn-helix domain-containing protein n=1 Tax=Galbibacter pacificus TaxID=2996052 RepID=A0ABT6FR07_9FLAO|nr:helix-turn-helix domain-containing protein [Galbibacter pacificus]MDG3581817.1 helix-turn-helix domain-containing protein [Galbibacter pacificus]MDG3585709.1 helix-turn-helix domain-containing protein [Galbibacter pacificus]
MTIWEILLLFFSFQSVLLGIFLFIKNRGYSYANRLFAIFLFMFGYGIYYVIMYWSGYSDTIKTAITFTFEIPFALFGPIFYFYVRNVVSGKKITIRDVYHFIPVICVFVSYGAFIFLPLERKLYLKQNGQIDQAIIEIPYFGYLLALLVIAYGIFTYWKFVKAYKEDFDLRIWLKTINLNFILFGLSFVVYFIIIYFGTMTKEYDYLISYAMVFFIGAASYFCIIQPEVFNGTPIGKVIPFAKYETSGLPTQFAKELKIQLKELMKSEKPYLNPNLNLDELASIMNISRHHASQLINEHFDRNFYEFINLYRVDEAKGMLKEGKNLNIEDIAFQCGFNNRISFYRAFKKSEGVPPTKFREHYQAS